MLTLSDLLVRVAGRTLLDGASASVTAGQRVGLVGANGAGKTTLFRLILGEAAPDEGAIEMPSRWRAATVPQEAPAGPDTPLQRVLAFDAERSQLLAEAETASDPTRIAEIHTRLADIGAHEAPARAASILAGLGRGWRMRVALAGPAVLGAGPPAARRADQPSGPGSDLWLEGYLKSYPRHAVLIVSHDRDLLNRARSERIVHLEGTGGWSLQAATTTASSARAGTPGTSRPPCNAKQLAQRRHMQAFVDRFRYKASKARQAQSPAQDAGPHGADRQRAWRSAPSPSTFPTPEQLSPPLITLDRVAVGYGGPKPVLDRLELRLDMDDRIALLGANGNGKSTFVKLLAGRLKPHLGQALGKSLQAQGRLLRPGPGRGARPGGHAPRPHGKRLMPIAQPGRLRSRLGRFGFGQDKAGVDPASASSPAARRQPAALRAHEPGGAPRPAARRAEALNDYRGAILLVSHDVRLIELTAERLWLVAEGRVRPFEGDMGDYRRFCREGESGRAAPSKTAGAASGESTSGARKAKRKEAAEQRAATAPLRRAIQKCEREIERLTTEQAKLRTALAKPSLYEPEADPAPVIRLQSDLKRTEEALTAAEAEWLELQSELELQEAG